jgi:hypothetical protein
MMRAPIFRRIERLEDMAPPPEQPEPHILVFVNPDGTESSRMVIQHAFQRTSPQIRKAGKLLS